jgi:hypothetical protein
MPVWHASDMQVWFTSKNCAALASELPAHVEGQAGVEPASAQLLLTP